MHRSSQWTIPDAIASGRQQGKLSVTILLKLLPERLPYEAHPDNVITAITIPHASMVLNTSPLAALIAETW